MVTQQDVIKKFMEFLDKTELKGKAAVDGAVQYASSDLYSNSDELIKIFLSDIRANISNYMEHSKDDDGGQAIIENEKKKFLKNYCGIDLDNEDTGAITGSDVSGNLTDLKTIKTIVPENGNSNSPIGTSFTKHGLTVIFDKIEDNDPLKQQKQVIIDGLYSWWIEEGLNLIERSYGISFKESGTTVKKIKLEFFDDSSEDSDYAYCVPDTGKPKQIKNISLKINIAKFKSITKDNKDGQVSDRKNSLDRVLNVLNKSKNCYNVNR